MNPLYFRSNTLDNKQITDMSTEELNAYRLTSLEEPTDEMLSAIMREAAEEAAESNRKAHAQYFASLMAKMQAAVYNCNRPHPAQR